MYSNAFSTVACAGASENAQARTLPKNIWPQDLARQGGATAFLFLCLFYCTASAKI